MEKNRKSNLLLAQERRLFEEEDECRFQLADLKNAEEELFYLNQSGKQLLSELADTYREPSYFFEQLQMDLHQEQRELHSILDEEIRALEKKRKDLEQELEAVHDKRMKALEEGE